MQHSRSPPCGSDSPLVALSNPEAFEQHRVSGRRERQQAAAFPRATIKRQRCRPPASAYVWTPLRRPVGWQIHG